MKRPAVFWILAFLLTIISAVIQRITGPTYPVSGTTTMQGKQIEYSFERSHGGETNAVVRIEARDSSIRGKVVWKRYRSSDEWQKIDMKNDNGMLSGELPHQPPGGKLQYQVLLDDGVESISVPEKEAVVMRFKGDVPLAILIPHIIAMFCAMLFSARAGLECFARNPSYKKFVQWTIGFLIVGGFILGPLVQLYAFNAWWTGWPFGGDLTDNKTAVALAAWVAAAIALRKTVNQRKWVLGASIVTMVVFLIPHSLFGTELKYDSDSSRHAVSAGIVKNGRKACISPVSGKRNFGIFIERPKLLAGMKD